MEDGGGNEKYLREDRDLAVTQECRDTVPRVNPCALAQRSNRKATELYLLCGHFKNESAMSA